jgi:carboxyl-terminal processing protease
MVPMSVGEGAIALRWAAARVTASPNEYASLDALAAAGPLPDATLGEFRKFALAQGVTIPAGADADKLLNRILLPRIADAKWGDAGFYRMRALLDSEVSSALDALPKAKQLATAAGQ